MFEVKYRDGFVANSSSSSFLFFLDSPISKEEIAELVHSAERVNKDFVDSLVKDCRKVTKNKIVEELKYANHFKFPFSSEIVKTFEKILADNVESEIDFNYLDQSKETSFFKRVSQEDIVQILKYFNFSPLFAFLDAIGGSASGLNNFNLVSDGYKIEDNILEMIASYYYDRLEAEQKAKNVYIVEYYDDSDPEFESGDLIRKESEKVIRISHH
ncbi:MAG: hypothetical protein RBS13_07640 [Bacteroidales bacterium]|nr:hypothetical protein [Bacteroidales bacterium]